MMARAYAYGGIYLTVFVLINIQTITRWLANELPN